MRTLITIALCLLLPCSAWALQITDPNYPTTLYAPPAEFDGPYSGHLTVRQLPQKQVVAACRALVHDYGRSFSINDHQRGCAIREKGRCIVVYVDGPHRGFTPEEVFRHELGHCNGWPSDHRR